MRRQFSIALAAMLVCTALCACSDEDKTALTETVTTVATDSSKGDFTVITAAADGEVVAATTREASSGLSQGLVYDCFGGDGEVMPLLGYWSAPREVTYNGQYFPDMKNDDYFAAVKESGVNLLIQTNDDYGDVYYTVDQTMTYCDKYELGYYVSDKSLFNNGFTGTTESLKARIEELSAHRSFAGFYLKDEPFTGTESGMSSACNTFYSAAGDKNIHLYLNMNPWTASTFGSTRDEKYTAYASYLDKLYGNAEIPLIAWDVYPLRASTFDFDRYFKNYNLCYVAAKNYNKVLAPFVSVSAEGSYKLPNEGELAWQVNTYLSLGAKSIYYFPMNSPLSFSSDVEAGDVVAMYDYFGNKTSVWYYVKEVNTQIQAVDQFLMKATHEAVIATSATDDSAGKTATSYAGTAHTDYLSDMNLVSSYNELSSVSGASMVGCFNYNGKSMFYVTNYDMNLKKSITLNFSSKLSMEITQRGKSVTVSANKVTLNLAAGEGALIRLK